MKESDIYQMSWGDTGAFESSALSNPGGSVRNLQVPKNRIDWEREEQEFTG